MRSGDPAQSIYIYIYIVSLIVLYTSIEPHFCNPRKPRERGEQVNVCVCVKLGLCERVLKKKIGRGLALTEDATYGKLP